LQAARSIIRAKPTMARRARLKTKGDGGLSRCGRRAPCPLSIRDLCQSRRQFDSPLPSPGSNAFAAGQVKRQVTPEGA